MGGDVPTKCHVFVNGRGRFTVSAQVAASEKSKPLSFAKMELNSSEAESVRYFCARRATVRCPRSLQLRTPWAKDKAMKIKFMKRILVQLRIYFVFLLRKESEYGFGGRY